MEYCPISRKIFKLILPDLRKNKVFSSKIIIITDNKSILSKYLSTVKAVMVRTVALAEVSAASPRMTQKASPKMYGYLIQI